jgi:hypothetical protein
VSPPSGATPSAGRFADRDTQIASERSVADEELLWERVPRTCGAPEVLRCSRVRSLASLLLEFSGGSSDSREIALMNIR